MEHNRGKILQIIFWKLMDHIYYIIGLKMSALLK